MRERDEGLQEADKTETAFYYLQPLPKTGKLTYARLSKKKSDTDAGGKSSVGVCSASSSSDEQAWCNL